MKKSNLFKLCCCAVFAAIICIFTFAFPVPLPNKGYFNFGDCFVIMASLLLGPLWGGLAAGVGAGLSDFILGYSIYIPATFIIKWLMAVGCYFLYKFTMSAFKNKVAVSVFLSAVVAEFIMIFGYFLFEIPLYGIGVAIADIIGNSIQGAIGAVSSSLLYIFVYKTGILKKFFNFKR